MAENILYPVGEEQEECAICKGPLYGIPGPLTSTYPNLVCDDCDRDAVTQPEATLDEVPSAEKRQAQRDHSDADDAIPSTGDNPVFIDGQKCWRRYKFGGHITRLDQFDCETLLEFCDRHRPE